MESPMISVPHAFGRLVLEVAVKLRSTKHGLEKHSQEAYSFDVHIGIY